MKNVIQSVEHDGRYFCAIHGYSPFYTADAAKARRFPDYRTAYEYAMRELFTTPDAFRVVEVRQS